ncbi:NAD-dependent malic enzyme [mine drainage metagenome]|uniref:NAD-dependent malic enzyme n=1 Tax=mine drainage metagenome TaxID=410659 RepID=A0A1J5SCS9_9ZZZZ
MNSRRFPKGLSPRGGPNFPRGRDLLTNSLLNKGTAFTEAERDALGLRGLLPPRIFPIKEQVQRALNNFRRKQDPLEKYIFLTTLQARNATLFYRLLQEYAEEMIPIIYTPTVGQACLEYGAIFRRPQGIFISARERGRMDEVLRHWPNQDVRMIVVTDGERILGLGDLGALGMGIPVGKLALYTACAGLHPYYTLPICLDVGTDNEKLRADPFYIGIDQKRLRGEEYDSFIEEFVASVQRVFPHALIQWEDFGNTNAFRMLHKYQERVPSFNDDIQGTASVALAGLIAALRVAGGSLKDQKILFLGAGEAGTGIGDLYVAAAREAGLSEAEARRRCWYVDSQGLVVKDRPGKLASHKAPFAHDHPQVPTLVEAVETLRPTALVGVSGSAHAFTREIIGAMTRINPRPIIFALSNPTSKAECTAEEAYAWSDGKAVFASGSPFPPVVYQGKTFVPGQGNNVYIFPGVGLGALVCESAQVTNSMFLKAAQRLASLVSEDDLSQGRIYPSLSRIRDVSIQIAVAVAEEAHRAGLARTDRPEDLEADIRSRVFVPEYYDYA